MDSILFQLCLKVLQFFFPLFSSLLLCFFYCLVREGFICFFFAKKKRSYSHKALYLRHRHHQQQKEVWQTGSVSQFCLLYKLKLTIQTIRSIPRILHHFVSLSLSLSLSLFLSMLWKISTAHQPKLYPPFRPS